MSLSWEQIQTVGLKKTLVWVVHAPSFVCPTPCTDDNWIIMLYVHCSHMHRTWPPLLAISRQTMFHRWLWITARTDLTMSIHVSSTCTHACMHNTTQSHIIMYTYSRNASACMWNTINVACTDDSSRVILVRIDDDPATDYINASYINVRE